MEARRLNGNTTLQLSGCCRTGKRGLMLMPSTVMINHLAKAVNQQLWTSLARDVVYPCRTQLSSHACQPLVVLSWAFNHHGLKLWWRVFTDHQVGVKKPQHTVEVRHQTAPHPWSLLPCPAQEPFCHPCGTGCWDHNTFLQKLIRFFITL